MGGHASTQKLDVTTNLTSSAIQTAAQNCINYVNNDNQIAIAGNGNVIGNVTQKLSVDVNSDCVAQLTQNSSFQSELADKISQSLSDKEQAMTQWLDNSKTDANDKLKYTIKTNISSNTTQTCLNNLKSKNILDVAGDDNVVKNVIQSSTTNLISHCMLGQGQTATAMNDATTTINQHSQYQSDNPFAFIADAISTVAKSTAPMIVLGVVLLFVFVVVVAILMRHRSQNIANATRHF